MKRKSFLFLHFFVFMSCCVLPAVSSYAQPATVTARLDGAQIVIGDRARLFIEAQQPQGIRLSWAAIPDTFNKLEIAERGPIDTSSQNGLTVYRQRLLITGFDSGLFTIPSFTFTAMPQAGAAYTISTDSFSLSVSTVPVDTTQPFKPIKGIMGVKGNWLDYLPYILLGAGLLGAIIGIIVYLKKRKKPLPVAPKLPEETLQQKTMRQLEELERQELWQKGKVKEYYIAMTDILRLYLEERFRIHAMEQTTDELLAQASRHNALARYNTVLSTILHTADLAKFAKAQPLPAEHTQTMELTKEFVRTTPSLPQNPEYTTQS